MAVNTIRTFAAALVIAVTLGLGAKAEAATIQLGFIIDRSGSLGPANFAIMTGGLSAAMNLIPVGGADEYEISVVSFAANATIEINKFLVDSAAARTTLAGNVGAIAYNPGDSGATNYNAAFTQMETALSGSPNSPAFTYVNFATDGAPNTGGTGVTQWNSLMANAGVDNFSIEGIAISAAGATLLQTNFCFPQPCDTSLPANFPAQGFYVGVADATGYADAIGFKVLTVTNQAVPEPGTLLLLGGGLAGLVVARRRRRAR